MRLLRRLTFVPAVFALARSAAAADNVPVLDQPQVAGGEGGLPQVR
jgi:hypothetical protein